MRVLIAAVVAVIVVLVIAVVLRVRSTVGLPTYQGKSAAEWQQLADDADPPTRIKAYDALAATKQFDLLAGKFATETDLLAKLHAARYLVEDPGVRPKVFAFVLSALRDPRVDAVLRRDDLLLIVQSLAKGGDAGPLVAPLKGLLREHPDVQMYLEDIAEYPQK